MKKRKITALLLSAVLSVSLLSGCSSSEETQETLTGTYYGQITAVDADAGTITIDVGTIDESGDAVSSESGMEVSSMITLTGESQTVTVTEDTTLTSQTMSVGVGSGTGGEGSGGFSGDGGSEEDAGDPEIPEDGDLTEGSAPSDTEGGGEVPDGAGGNGDGEAPSDAGTTAPDDAGSSAGDGSVPDDLPSDAEGGGGEAPSGAQNGEMAGGGDFGGESGDLPDGDMGDGDFSGGEAGSASGDAFSAEDAASSEITIDDLGEGDIISVTYDDEGSVSEIVLLYDSDAADAMETPDEDEGGMSGDIAGVTSTVNIDYTALLEITENTTLDGETYESTGTDEETVWVNSGAVAALTNMLLTRDSDDSTGGDNSSFYGVGAALLTTVGTTYISDSTITTDAAGGAGIFSYGDGVTYVSDTTITTQQDTSGGIHVAGGGTLYAWDLTVETYGESSAAIRSDRGSGTMVVDGGTYTSNGTGSPAVYSTAEIAVNDAELTANGSEAVCIEGLNSIYLFDCDLTGNMADDSQNDTTWTVTLYQSQSGDSEEGNSTFQMIGGTLTSQNGGLFYTTNTESTFLLEDVDITASDDCEFFLMCTGNANERGWGTSGSNGADCSFTAIDQEMDGDVIWDSISTLDFYITEDSTLTGAVINDETYAGSGGSGYCSIYIDKESTWIVTGDSTVTNLYNAGTITDASGKTVSIIGSDGTTYINGTSSYTITVESYSTSVDLSGASTASSWSEFEVEKPDALG